MRCNTPRHINNRTREASTSDDCIIWGELTPKEWKRAMRWFAARSHDEQAEIFSTYVLETLPQLKGQNMTKQLDSYMHLAAFLLAIRKSGFDTIRKRGYRIAGATEFTNYEKLRNGVLNSIRNRKKSPIRQEVLAYWGDISVLRKKGTGFLLISRYMMRAHKVKISPSYLSKLWKEREG